MASCVLLTCLYASDAPQLYTADGSNITSSKVQQAADLKPTDAGNAQIVAFKNANGDLVSFSSVEAKDNKALQSVSNTAGCSSSKNCSGGTLMQYCPATPEPIQPSSPPAPTDPVKPDVPTKPDTPPTNPDTPPAKPDTGTGAGPGPALPEHEPTTNDSTFINNTYQTVQDTARLELVDAALQRKEAIQQAIHSDDNTLNRYYDSMQPQQIQQALARAEKGVEHDLSALSAARDPASSGDYGRFALAYQNALDKIKISKQALQDEMQNPATLQAASAGLTSKNGLAQTPSLAQVFSNYDPETNQMRPISPQDEMINRIVMLNGLTPSQRREALSELKLAEPLKLKESDGTQTVIVPHNGYVFGAGKTGADCSSFVNSLLPGGLQLTRFTTLDFAAMWYLLVDGKIPKPPTMKPGRQKIVSQAAKAFIPVNLYKDQPLAIGDLLIFRLPWLPIGHVFIVRDYNAKTKVARVIDASQTAGTIIERDFALSAYPLDAPKRYTKAGLMGLRLKSNSNEVCSYRDHSKSGAAKRYTR